MEMGKGHCRHGPFELKKGCPQCIEERRAGPGGPGANTYGAKPEPHIVKVRYFSETTGELSTREYTYFSEDRLAVGDVVMAPVKLFRGDSPEDKPTKAKVTAINVPESEIAAFKDKVKTIPAGAKMKPRAELPRAAEAGDAIERVAKEIQESLPTCEEMAERLIPADEEFTAEPAPETALVWQPGEDVEARGYYTEAVRLLDYAHCRVIATVDDLKPANDDLVEIGKLKKAMEAKRVELVKPKQDWVKAVQETYKALMAPVFEAEQITRNKMTAFKLEQDRKAQKAEEVNRQAIELARKQAEMNQGEFTVDTTPVAVPPAPKLTRTEQGTSGLTAHWKYRIVDIEQIPRPYMIPDDAMLNAIATKHHDQKPVPGVEFYNDPHITTRSR